MKTTERDEVESLRFLKSVEAVRHGAKVVESGATCLVTGEAEEDGAVGGVAFAGEGERAVELGADANDVIEQAVFDEPECEAVRGAHGAHGVRTGGTDAEFVEIEEAGRHG